VLARQVVSQALGVVHDGRLESTVRARCKIDLTA
jgi:hypothetical protein